MNTQAQDPQRLRALELALQARREILPEEDQRFLDSYLSAHPDVEKEVRGMDDLLGRLKSARLPVRPEFEQKMQSDVAGWIRDEALSRPTVTTSHGRLRRRWEWLVGRQDTSQNVSGSTLFLGRSLAFYLGAASVIVAFLMLREPAPGPEVRTNDRAHEFTDQKPPVEKPRKPADLRGGPRPK